MSGAHFYAHDMGDSVLTEIISLQVREQAPKFFSDGVQSATFTNGNMIMSQANLRTVQRLGMAYPTLVRFFGTLTARHFFKPTI